MEDDGELRVDQDGGADVRVDNTRVAVRMESTPVKLFVGEFKDAGVRSEILGQLYDADGSKSVADHDDWRRRLT